MGKLTPKEKNGVSFLNFNNIKFSFFNKHIRIGIRYKKSSNEQYQ